MTDFETPRRRGEISEAGGPDEWIVVHPESGEAHLLNVTARAIWELCDGETTSSEMASAISELTGIELTVVADDVESTIERLFGLGLVY